MATLRSGAGLLSSLIRLIVSVVALIIFVAILLVVLKANPANSVVSEINQWAHSLARPLGDIFSFHSASETTAVNWGIAAVLYLIAGGLLARLISRPYR